MEFLLNHTGLFVFSSITLLAQSFFMIIAFYLSKLFIEVEVNKLKKDSTHLDIGIILAFGLILSTIISFVGTMAINAVARYFYPNPDYLYNSYFELLIVFSAVLLASCALFSKPKEHLRFKHLSHEESQSIHNRFLRTVAISLIITILAYALVNTFLGTQYGLMCEYGSIGIIILYCFIEVSVSSDILTKILNIKKSKISSISVKLTNFINSKFRYVTLFCMIYAIEINCRNQLSETAAFTHINNVYLFLLAIIAFQCVIVLIINKFADYISSIDDSSHSKQFIQNRSKNMIWICNFIVLSMYFTMICVAMQYSGINIKKYVINEYFLVGVIGVFVTTMICRIFNEFRDSILEKAEKGDKEHYTKLKTFAPTFSTIFYFVLLLTAILIILSNFGVDVTPVVASFSIFSAAFALASQDIIKAFLHGLTLLIEKNLYVGDFITINDKSGTIERLSVRVVYLRALNGSLHVIPYNLINAITNYSKGYKRHSELLRLVSKDDVEKASKILINVVEQMKREPKYEGKILSDVVIHGVQPFDLSGIKINWEVVTDATLVHFANDVYRRLIAEFDKNGIKVPQMASNISVNEQ